MDEETLMDGLSGGEEQGTSSNSQDVTADENRTDDTQGSDGQPDETSGGTSESVPYNRFKEVIDERNEYKSFKEKYEELQKQIEETQNQSSEEGFGDMSPKMQKLIQDIAERASTQAEERMLKNLATRQEQEQQKIEKSRKEAEKIITDLKEKVGSEDLFKSEFTPFAKKFLDKFPDMPYTRKNMMGIYEAWKENGGGKSKDRVSPGSASGGTSKSKFKVDPRQGISGNAREYFSQLS